MSDTDVLTVLNDLTKLLKFHPEDEKNVRFGNFGAFHVSIPGSGPETEEKFHSSLITKSKIKFRPGNDLRNMLLTLKYTKKAEDR